MSIRFRSHVSIDEGPRAQLVEGLDGILAATHDLTSQVTQAHWHLERGKGERVDAPRPTDAPRVEGGNGNRPAEAGRSEAHEVAT